MSVWFVPGTERFCLLICLLAVLENELNALCMQDTSCALIIPSSPDSVLLINSFVPLFETESCVAYVVMDEPERLLFLPPPPSPGITGVYSLIWFFGAGDGSQGIVHASQVLS